MQRKILGLLFIGMVAINLSCEKQKTGIRKAGVILENGNNPKIGDDDDEPIIQGKVKKKHSFALVSGAQVDTYEYGTNAIINSQYTDASGEFTEQVKSGIYYFGVTAPGSTSPYLTGKFTITQNRGITILVD